MLPLFPPSSQYGVPPAHDELEVSVIGPGFGEAIAVHVGDGKWFLIDSCIADDDRTPATKRYFHDIGASLDSVFMIVISHWDDDHCKGMSELVRSCAGSIIAMSNAFIEKDFLAFVAAYRSPLTASVRSGVKEIKETLEELRRTGRTVIKGTGDAKRLYAPMSITVSHGAPVEIWSLAPSDFEHSNFLLWAASQMPAVGETRRVATKRKRNDLSTVIHASVGNDVMLFGGDLEEEGRPDTGWSAVLGSTGRPSSKAGLFKVAHHGSASGDHPSVWTDLLSPDPVAIVAPFRNGNQSLPSATDAPRIIAQTSQAFGTTTLKGTASPRKDSMVEKTIREVTKNFTTIKPKLGMVRARKKVGAGGPWNIEMFGDAVPLPQIR